MHPLQRDADAHRSPFVGALGRKYRDHHLKDIPLPLPIGWVETGLDKRFTGLQGLQARRVGKTLALQITLTAVCRDVSLTLMDDDVDHIFFMRQTPDMLLQ